MEGIVNYPWLEERFNRITMSVTVIFVLQVVTLAKLFGWL